MKSILKTLLIVGALFCTGALAEESNDLEMTRGICKHLYSPRQCAQYPGECFWDSTMQRCENRYNENRCSWYNHPRDCERSVFNCFWDFNDQRCERRP